MSRLEEAWNDFQNNVLGALPHGERGMCISCDDIGAGARALAQAVHETYCDICQRARERPDSNWPNVAKEHCAVRREIEALR